MRIWLVTAPRDILMLLWAALLPALLHQLVITSRPWPSVIITTFVPLVITQRPQEHPLAHRVQLMSPALGKRIVQYLQASQQVSQLGNQLEAHRHNLLVGPRLNRPDSRLETRQRSRPAGRLPSLRVSLCRCHQRILLVNRRCNQHLVQAQLHLVTQLVVLQVSHPVGLRHSRQVVQLLCPPLIARSCQVNHGALYRRTISIHIKLTSSATCTTYLSTYSTVASKHAVEGSARLGAVPVLKVAPQPEVESFT